MLAEMGPWAIFAAFVLSLVGFVFWVLRRMIRGDLVQRVVYDDMRDQRDGWKDAFNALAPTLADLSTNVGRMVSVAEQQTASVREVLEVVRRLVPAPDTRSVA